MLLRSSVHFKLCSFITTEPCGFLHMVQMLLRAPSVYAVNNIIIEVGGIVVSEL